jgi:hypothetical protein
MWGTTCKHTANERTASAPPTCGRVPADRQLASRRRSRHSLKLLLSVATLALSVATSEGENPIVFWKSGSAPAPSSSLVTPTFPCSAAWWSAVRPCESLASADQPASSSSEACERTSQTAGCASAPGCRCAICRGGPRPESERTTHAAHHPPANNTQARGSVDETRHPTSTASNESHTPRSAAAASIAQAGVYPAQRLLGAFVQAGHHFHHFHIGTAAQLRIRTTANSHSKRVDFGKRKTERVTNRAGKGREGNYKGGKRKRAAT